MINEPASQRWFAIEIVVVPEGAEAIEHAFNALDSLGTEINHLRKGDGETIKVVGYFNLLPDDSMVQDELHYALRIYGLTEDAIVAVERCEVANTDWLQEWKKHWKPTEIGRFIVAPPWEAVDGHDKIVIRIEPNMAFGTGTHETTQLCLKAIEKYFVPGQSFLDVGTGTGILSIAAAKLDFIATNASSRFLACDTDVDSIAIARENANLNGVGEQIEFYVGHLTGNTPPFDFVCANLTIDVILPILPLLLETTDKTLVLSGILTEQKQSIVEELRKNKVNDFEIEQSGEWIAASVNIQRQRN